MSMSYFVIASDDNKFKLAFVDYMNNVKVPDGKTTMIRLCDKDPLELADDKDEEIDLLEGQIEGMTQRIFTAESELRKLKGEI